MLKNSWRSVGKHILRNYCPEDLRLSLLDELWTVLGPCTFYITSVQTFKANLLKIFMKL
jgi:hypothetical protein